MLCWDLDLVGLEFSHVGYLVMYGWLKLLELWLDLNGLGWRFGWA